MHKQVCVHIPQTVKFVSKFSRKPLSGISDQSAPPNEKLQIWGDQSLLRNTPPPMKNFRFEMTKVYSRIPSPPPKWKTSDLKWPKFTPEYLPPPVGSESGRSYVETKSVSPVDTISYC